MFEKPKTIGQLTADAHRAESERAISKAAISKRIADILLIAKYWLVAFSIITLIATIRKLGGI